MVLFFDWSTDHHVRSHHRHREDLMAYTTKKIERILSKSNRQLARRNDWAVVVLRQMYEEYLSWLACGHLGTLVVVSFIVISGGGSVRAFLNASPLLIALNLIVMRGAWMWYADAQPNRALFYLQCLRARAMTYDPGRRQWEPVHIRRKIRELEAEISRVLQSSERDRDATVGLLQQSMMHLQAEGDRLARLMAARIDLLRGAETAFGVVLPPAGSKQLEGSTSVLAGVGSLSVAEPSAESTPRTDSQGDAAVDDEAVVEDSLTRR